MLYLLYPAAPAAQNPSCPAYAADTAVISCWFKYLDRIPRKQGIREAVPILRSLGGYTSRFPLLEAHRLRKLGWYYMQNQKSDSSLIFLNEAKRMYAQLGNNFGLSVTEQNLGDLILGKGEDDKAIQCFYSSIHFAEKAGVDSLKVLSYIGLAHIFESLKDGKKEREFLAQAYHIAKKNNNSKKITIAGVSLMLSYIETSELDSARLIADHVLKNMPDNHTMKACSYYALAVWETAQGHWDLANRHYLQMKTAPNMPEHFRHHFSLSYAEFLTERKLYKQALPVYEDVVARAREYQTKEIMHNVLAKYHAFLSATGDYKRAYETSVEYLALHDSLHREEMEERVRDIHIKYETAEKETALQASKLALSEQTNQRNLLLAGMVSLLFLGGGAFLWQRNRIALREKEAQIARQNVEQMRQTQEHTAFRAMVAGEETERNRLARELHDGLGGILSGLKLALTARKKGETDMNTAVEMVDKAGSELRRIAQNLMPEALAKFGLVNALEDLCGDLEELAGFQISFQHYGLDAPLPDRVRLPLYRIVQEALNNIVKHSGASEVMVELILDEGKLHLTVEDDGRGFNPDSEENGRGNGLKNIASRVRYLQGTMEIDSATGQGATLNITIPIENDHD